MVRTWGFTVSTKAALASNATARQILVNTRCKPRSRKLAALGRRLAKDKAHTIENAKTEELPCQHSDWLTAEDGPPT